MKYSELFLTVLINFAVLLHRATPDDSERHCRNVGGRRHDEFFNLQDKTRGSFSIEEQSVDRECEKPIENFFEIHRLTTPSNLESCPKNGEFFRVNDITHKFIRVQFQENIKLKYAVNDDYRRKFRFNVISKDGEIYSFAQPIDENSTFCGVYFSLECARICEIVNEEDDDAFSDCSWFTPLEYMEGVDMAEDKIKYLWKKNAMFKTTIKFSAQATIFVLVVVFITKCFKLLIANLRYIFKPELSSEYANAPLPQARPVVAVTPTARSTEEEPQGRGNDSNYDNNDNYEPNITGIQSNGRIRNRTVTIILENI